jgi:hypothetical protein
MGGQLCTDVWAFLGSGLPGMCQVHCAQTPWSWSRSEKAHTHARRGPAGFVSSGKGDGAAALFPSLEGAQEGKGGVGAPPGPQRGAFAYPLRTGEGAPRGGVCGLEVAALRLIG